MYPLEIPPAADPGQPLWLNLLYLLAWVLVSLGGLWLVNRPLRKQLDAIKNDVPGAVAAGRAVEQIRSGTAHVVAETSANHGHSMKDRLEQVLTQLKAVAGDITGLRIENREDRSAAVEAHKQIYAVIEADRARAIEQHDALMAAVQANWRPPS